MAWMCKAMCELRCGGEGMGRGGTGLGRDGAGLCRGGAGLRCGGPGLRRGQRQCALPNRNNKTHCEKKPLT
ncbi:hypothetical protein [Halobacillus sp. K22]|uniref:hypothetical protein n=1 Tax=Halobacillus sp. K22 TaxID=3457431 RepID=UPI003FCE543D